MRDCHGEYKHILSAPSSNERHHTGTPSPSQVLCETKERVINAITFLCINLATCLHTYTTKVRKHCRFRRPFNSAVLAAKSCHKTGSACVDNTYPTTALRVRRKVLSFKSDHPSHPGLVHMYLFFLFKEKTLGSREILSTFPSPPHLWNITLYTWSYWSEHKHFLDFI